MAWTNPKTWQTGFANRATAADFNTHLRDNLLFLYRPPIRKTADQSVTSSTALVSDTHLLMAMAVSEVYEFEFIIFFTAATAGDIKLALNVPAGATGSWGAIGPDTTTPTNYKSFQAAAFGDATTVTFGGNAANEALFISGVVIQSSTAGNLQLRWAQSTSSGTATTILTNSVLKAVRF
jgi:hypothetical protein